MAYPTFLLWWKRTVLYMRRDQLLLGMTVIYVVIHRIHFLIFDQVSS